MPAIGTPQAQPAADEVTIGVSLPIPDPWAAVLRRHREEFGDPRAGSVPTHITLLPPTAVPVRQVAGIEAHLWRVAGRLARFELRLEGTDTFRPVSPVVFVRVVAGGPACDRAQRAVRTGPLEVDLTFPYHPHVTVAHHLDDAALDRAMAELAGFTADFVIDSFVLYEHGADGVWRPRQRFDFGGPAG